MGRRVEPRIDPSLKAKYEKVDQAKENKGIRGTKPNGKKTTTAAKKEEGDEDEDDILENSSLFDRILKRSPEAALMKSKQAKKGITKFLTTETKKTKKKEEEDEDMDEGEENGVEKDVFDLIDDDEPAPSTKNGKNLQEAINRSSSEWRMRAD